MKVSKDSFVVIEYDLRLDNGTFVKGENGAASMNFIAGYGQVMPALEDKLMGLEQGTETQFVIEARDAFGEYDDRLVRTRTFLDFPAGRHLEPGKWVIATNEETKAQYSYLIREKTDTAITMDYNHPLAGKDLHYRVKVVHVRQALKEELEFLRPCEQEKQGRPDGN